MITMGDIAADASDAFYPLRRLAADGAADLIMFERGGKMTQLGSGEAFGQIMFVNDVGGHGPKEYGETCERLAGAVKVAAVFAEEFPAAETVEWLRGLVQAGCPKAIVCTPTPMVEAWTTEFLTGAIIKRWMQ